VEVVVGSEDTAWTDDISECTGMKMNDAARALAAEDRDHCTRAATVRMEDALLDHQPQIQTKFTHTSTLLSWVGLYVCTF